MSYSVRRPLYEIVQEASEAATPYDKVMTLRKNDSASLRKLLRFAIDPNLKFVLGEELPPYSPAKENGLEPLLYNRVRLLYLFVERQQKLDMKIMHRCLVELLEAIHPQDAELILQVIRKKLPKGLSKQIVIQAFPGILDEQIVELQH